MSTLFVLSGKIAGLTSALKGIGLAIATAVAEHDVKVVIS